MAAAVDLDAAIEWLLASGEPAVRFLARRDLLGDRSPPDAAEILAGPLVSGLLAGQQEDGGFGVHPYAKWRGAHWRLVSLVELAAPSDDPRLRAAAETVLDWLTGSEHRRRIRTIDGLVRRCASQEGNALAVACRLGLATDSRVALLAESLTDWQWPDGGWNCDPRASGRRSSFNESLAPMWGLHEYGTATGGQWALAAAERTAELLLDHHVFRSLKTGEPVHPAVIVLHYPPYWHYDLLQALRHPRQARQGPRSEGRRRDRAPARAPRPGRPLAPGRLLVEAAGKRGLERRGRRLGAVAPQRDADVERAARPARRRVRGRAIA